MRHLQLSRVITFILLLGIIMLPGPVQAFGKKTGAPITLELAAASARIENVAIGDEITSSFIFTPLINADAMNIRIKAVKGVELLSEKEPKFTTVVAGEAKQVDVRLRVLDKTAQILLFFQTVVGSEYAGQFQNVFYEQVDGGIRAFADGLKIKNK